jgi:hypothetical protein
MKENKYLHEQLEIAHKKNEEFKNLLDENQWI